MAFKSAVITSTFWILCLLANAQSQTRNTLVEPPIAPVNAGRNATGAIPACVAEGYARNDILEFHVLKVDHSTFVKLTVLNEGKFRSKLSKDCKIAPKNYLNWHIHQKATFKGDIGIGAGECNSDTVGGHWDPTLACGPSSGNPLCKKLKIPPSSALTPNTSGKYKCDPVTHNAINHFACEAGDLSGKYGQLRVPSRELRFTAFIIDGLDPIAACELNDLSVVVHCGGSMVQAVCLRLSVKHQTMDYYNSTVAAAQSSIEEYNEELRKMAEEDEVGPSPAASTRRL